MTILKSLNTGASGLRSHGRAMGVTSDNIANVNTVGFKRSRAVFQDILGRSINSNIGASPMAGAGSKVGAIQQMWSQGALLTTDAPTDLALNGDGFFVVDGNLGGIDGRYYTRAGQFRIDESGTLVNPSGMRLQGYTVNPDGSVSGQLGDLNVEGAAIPATPTENVEVGVQLDSNEAVIGRVATPFDPADPDTYHHSTETVVYDSLGNAHSTTMYFTKTAPNEWSWNAVVDGAEVAGAPAGPFEIASGTLTFTTEGALDTETAAPVATDFTDATPGQQVNFDFGDAITTDGGTGLEGSTQFADESTTTSISQDGYAAGTVAGISVAGDGTVNGVFSNGQQRILGRVAVADFASVDGLERAGSSLWAATQDAGEPLIDAASTGGRGSIVSGALEQSNVDIGQEFVDLIGFQRGFQANSRIITTADEMYGELVNLKR